jgi:hypothetical protein
MLSDDRDRFDKALKLAKSEIFAKLNHDTEITQEIQ